MQTLEYYRYNKKIDQILHLSTFAIYGSYGLLIFTLDNVFKRIIMRNQTWLSLLDYLNTETMILKTP